MSAMNQNGQVKVEDDEDDLYAMIYGEDAPQALAKTAPPVPIKQESTEFQDIYGHSAPEDQLYSYEQKPSQLQQQQQQQLHQQPQLQPVNSQTPLQPKVQEEEDEDEDFDIQLDAPQPAAQLRPEADEDDLDIQLDEPIAGLPPSIAQRPASQQVPPARQSSAGGAPHATQPGMPAVPGPRPPPGPPGTGLNPRPGVPPPRPPPGPPPLGHPAAPVMAPPPMPSQWPRPQFVHTGAGASNLPRDEGNAVLPSQAGDSQLIRLPGQTRVSPEEYKEFLGLGHGDVFDLDPDRVVQAPWRMPGADPADFFNYGMNINTWKEYVARIHQFRLEFSMQKKIQTYESSNDAPALDPDLPPELAAAVAQGRQQGMTNSAAGPASTSQPSRPLPVQRHQPSAPKPSISDDVGTAIALTGGSDNAISLTGGSSQDASKQDTTAKGHTDAADTAADKAADKAAAEAVPVAEGLVAQAKASKAPASGQASSTGDRKPDGEPPRPKPPPGKPPGTGPTPPNPGMANGPGPPSSRAPPSGPGFIRPPTGMRPIEGAPGHMNGNLAMSMGMSGPMGGGFRPPFPHMGPPFPMMPMGPYPMMHGMPGPMMMGAPGPMQGGGPMGPPPMGRFMPDFGRDGFNNFGDRPFMEGPHMFGGGRGTPPYEDDDHGMGGFRGEDSGAGAEDALAMGMDVDIPPASLAGDRREAERRRGREGRYEQDDYRRSGHRGYDRPHDEDGDYPRHRRREWDSSEEQDRGRERSRDRDSHRSSYHESTDSYERHSRYR